MAMLKFSYVLSLHRRLIRSQLGYQCQKFHFYVHPHYNWLNDPTRDIQTAMTKKEEILDDLTQTKRVIRAFNKLNTLTYKTIKNHPILHFWKKEYNHLENWQSFDDFARYAMIADYDENYAPSSFTLYTKTKLGDFMNWNGALAYLVNISDEKSDGKLTERAKRACRILESIECL